MGQVFGNAKHVKSNSMNMNNSFNTGIYSNSNSISNLNSQMYMKTKLKKQRIFIDRIKFQFF